MTSDRAEVTCAEFADEVAELASGAVAEPRRSVLLAHAGGCARCSAELAETVAVGDALLHVAPPMEPPAGFETRAVAGMAGLPADGASWRRPRRLAAAAAAAAAVVLVLVIVASVVATRVGAGSGERADIASGSIVAASGRAIGTAELERGASLRIVLTMDGDSRWGGTWVCELRDDAGRWVEIGSWTADDVTGGVWAAGVPEDVADSTRMRILDGTGRVVASARLD